MREYKTYRDLNAWISARQLCAEVYSLTQKFPSSEQFGLTNQLRRAVVSVASNIAEGHGRQYKKETIQFLYTSKGSLNEVETQLILATDLKFLKEDELNKVLATLDSTRKQLLGFIKFLSNEKDLKH